MALTRAFSQPVRHIRQERGPKNFSEALKEMFQSMMGGFTFRGAAEDFINDVKYITGPASNFTDAIKPLRIDTSKKMTRFSKIHSDSEYGGKSFCSSRILQDDDVPSTENATSEDNSFVRFQGELNFPENKDAKIKTSGFCAAQAVCRKVLDLVDYEGVEIIVRSKEARSYILGMKTMSLSMLNDMQYQV